MLNRYSIAWRMTILVLLGAGLILGSISAYSNWVARSLINGELEGQAKFVANSVAGRINAVEQSVTGATTRMASAIGANPSMSDSERETMLRNALMWKDDIYGAAVVPYTAKSDSTGKCVVSYVHRVGGKLITSQVTLSTSPKDLQDRFSTVMKTGRPDWYKPYFGQGLNKTLMVTCACPIYVGKEHKFWGVVESDVSLDWLRSLLLKLPLGKSGYAFLVSSDGTYIAHPVKKYVGVKKIADVAVETNRQDLAELAGRIPAKKSGFSVMRTGISDRDSGLALSPVRSTGWTVGVMLPLETLMQPIVKLDRADVGIGITGFAVLLLIALLIARSISMPIRHLDAVTRTLSTGNLENPLPVVDGNDEVAHLSHSFEAMRRDLKTQIEKLRVTTEAKQRIETEIHIARDIQMSLVPSKFPAYPNRHDFDLFAILDPAREVGGDFYNFSLIDSDHLSLVIGDVAGKGIPGAMFMAVTVTLLKALTTQACDPAEVLRKLNEEICEQNDSNMFATIFFGVLCLSTGELSYANAGHNPPFIFNARDGVSEIPRAKGPAVGISPMSAYKAGALTMQTGDTLFLYTDGVTEAANAGNELFGVSRTKRILSDFEHESTSDLLLDLRKQVLAYSYGAEQSDDITMLAVKYLGEM